MLCSIHYIMYFRLLSSSNLHMCVYLPRAVSLSKASGVIPKILSPNLFTGFTQLWQVTVKRQDPHWWWKIFGVMTAACITVPHQIPLGRFPERIGSLLKVCKLFCLLPPVSVPFLLDSWATGTMKFKKKACTYLLTFKGSWCRWI